MKVYQVDNRWYVRTEGGYRNDEIVPEEVLGPFEERPEPVTRWKKTEENYYGSGVSIFTRFRAGKEEFTVEDYTWEPALGYSWSESWERLSDELPPELGEAYRWSDERGWVKITHPMAVEQEEGER